MSTITPAGVIVCSGWVGHGYQSHGCRHPAIPSPADLILNLAHSWWKLRGYTILFGFTLAAVRPNATDRHICPEWGPLYHMVVYHEWHRSTGLHGDEGMR